MDILLVNPPVNRLCDISSNYFPLGIGYLSAITNGLGFKTSIYNAELDNRSLPIRTNRRRLHNHCLFVKALSNDNHPVWQEYRDILTQFKPKIVGFSCTSASIIPCIKMAEDAKRLIGAKTIFGGMHPTILPEETAKNNAVDYVVAGEAERSFPALVKAILEKKDIFSISGVGTVKNQKFRMSVPETLIQDIERFPFPDRDNLLFMDKHKYHLQAFISSRGCPYNCTFCSGRHMHKASMRYRSLEKILEEINFLKEKYGVTTINFYDDFLISNKNRITKLCQMMIERKIGLNWSAFSRVDAVDDELLKLMKESGCIALGMGVESGSNRVLHKIKKGYKREDTIRGVNLVKDSGIAAEITMMIGFPFETEEDIKDSIDLIEELDVPTNVNTFTPYPGSEVFEESVKLGLIEDKIDWSRVSQHSPYNLFIKEIPQERYKDLLDEMIEVADNVTMANAEAINDYLSKKALSAEDAVLKKAFMVADKNVLNRIASFADDDILNKIALSATPATQRRLFKLIIKNIWKKIGSNPFKLFLFLFFRKILFKGKTLQSKERSS